MIGPETGTLVFCQPCSGRQSVRIWQQYNLLKGSPNLILMIGSFLNCNGRLQNAARLKGQHMMSCVRQFDESNWQLLVRDGVIPHLMSQGQWSVVTSPMRRHLVSALTILHPAQDFNGAKQEAGIWGRCSQGQGEGGSRQYQIYEGYLRFIGCYVSGSVRFFIITIHLILLVYTVYFLVSW